MTAVAADHQAVFRAMGTTVSVRLVGTSSREAGLAFREVEALFQREEARFSRFDPGSELSRLNRRGRLGQPSKEMRDVLLRAEEWRSATNGCFDPAVLPALEAAGYDRTLALVVAGAGATKRGASAPVAVPGPPISFRADGGVALAKGVRIDLGGLVKGWTVDRAAGLLAGRASGYMVDAGGDLRVGGRPPCGDAWLIGVQDPCAEALDQDVVPVREGGVATSGTYRRRWRSPDGRMAHHLIDPRTGAPSKSDAMAATVVAESAEAADVLAKCACLRGLAAGVRVLEARRGTQGLVTGTGGTRMATRGWPGLAYRLEGIGRGQQAAG